MNISPEDFADLIRIWTAFERTKSTPSEAPARTINNGMIGQYVIVRCRDAGVHAGYLKDYSGREALLEHSRRLWRWKPAEGGLLSSVAVYGLDYDESIIGEAQPLMHLTETCEIALCSDAAEASIAGAPRSHR